MPATTNCVSKNLAGMISRNNSMDAYVLVDCCFEGIGCLVFLLSVVYDMCGVKAGLEPD